MDYNQKTKMKNWKFLILVVLLFSACDTSKEKLPVSEIRFKSLNQYMETIQHKQELIQDTVYFVFANNPYQLDSSCYLSVFANNKNIYAGPFKKSIAVDAVHLRNSKRTNFMFEVLTNEKTDALRLNRFTNKSSIAWQDDYKFLYACFFPTNENEEQVQFFPYKGDITY